MSRFLQKGTVLKGKEHSYRVKQDLPNGKNSLHLANRDDGLEVIIKSFDLENEFERECEIQEALIACGRHKNILYMLEAFVDKIKLQHLVVPYVKGGDLWDYIFKQQKSPLHPSEFLHFFQGICDGISYMHNQGIVHCDIKPNNVLLETLENSEEITRADLAAGKVTAKITDFEGAFKKDFHQDSYAGTLEYMPPESYYQ